MQTAHGRCVLHVRAVPGASSRTRPRAGETHRKWAAHRFRCHQRAGDAPRSGSTGSPPPGDPGAARRGCHGGTRYPGRLARPVTQTSRPTAALYIRGPDCPCRNGCNARTWRCWTSACPAPAGRPPPQSWPCSLPPGCKVLILTGLDACGQPGRGAGRRARGFSLLKDVPAGGRSHRRRACRGPRRADHRPPAGRFAAPRPRRGV